MRCFRFIRTRDGKVKEDFTVEARNLEDALKNAHSYGYFRGEWDVKEVD